MKSNQHRKDNIYVDNVINLEEKKNILKLAGSEPPKNENWLKDLALGSIFLGRFKQSQNGLEALFLHKFLVTDHKTMSTNMLWATPDGGQKEVWVNTLEFSRKFELAEVIGIIGVGQEPRDEHDEPEATQGEAAGSGEV